MLLLSPDEAANTPRPKSPTAAEEPLFICCPHRDNVNGLSVRSVPKRWRQSHHLRGKSRRSKLISSSHSTTPFLPLRLKILANQPIRPTRELNRPLVPQTGYTHASRGELAEAEASARLMLEIIDRHAAVLHLPLTFTLAEASRRLLRATAEQSSRPALPGVHVDALRAARAQLCFARPRPPAKAGGGGGAGATSGGGGGSGGGCWCAFGSEILSAFEKAAGGDGGGGLPEVSGGVFCGSGVGLDAWDRGKAFSVVFG